MPSPRVVVFDLGMVLLDFDYARAAAKIAANADAAPDVIKALIDQTPLLIRYETGLMTSREFYDAVRAQTGYRGDFAGFADVFGDIFEPILPMVEIHAALRAKKIPLFVCSNTNELAIRHIRRSFPFFDDFDGYIFSHEHGAMKPAVKIYEIVERETKHHGAQICYLDDREVNVAAGAARGWHSIWHQTPEQTRAALVSLHLLD